MIKTQKGQSFFSIFLLWGLLLLWVPLAGCGIQDPTDNKGQDAGAFDTDGGEQPEPAPTSYEAWFSHPEPGQPDETIEAKIVEFLEQAPQDTTIRAAFYTFGRDSVAEAFGDAHDRGADVRVVLGNTSRHSGGADWSAVTILRDRLGSRLTVCRDGESDGGCLGENIQHNKFITFSELADGSGNVVFQTSANLTEFQLSQYNNLLIVRDDPALYDAYFSYWEDLRRDETNLEYDRSVRGDGETKVYFFPLSEGDPILEALERVDCQQGASVYVAMAFFTNSRSDVAEQMRQMDQEGCQIRVVLRERPQINSPGIQIMGNLETGDIDVAIFPEEEAIQLHSKYMLIDGHYDGQGDRKVVWTGSHNFTISALRYNDETVLKVEDDEIFEAYRGDWQHLRQRAVDVHP